jgi:hypothetical protein
MKIVDRIALLSVSDKVFYLIFVIYDIAIKTILGATPNLKNQI